MSSSVIKSPTPILEKKGFTVFLAGPMKGAPKWQRTVPKIAESIGIDGVTWLNPYRCQRWVTWREQVAWETQGLRDSDVALFWIPNQETEVEGRDYAQTTRMELLENLARGKRVILGIDDDIRAADYMKYKAKSYGVRKIHKTLEGCLEELRDIIREEESRGSRSFSVGDLCFGSEDALAARPQFSSVLDMNQTIVERWNRQVGLHDTVWCSGDVGDESWLRLLNGDIRFGVPSDDSVQINPLILF